MGMLSCTTTDVPCLQAQACILTFQLMKNFSSRLDLLHLGGFLLTPVAWGIVFVQQDCLSLVKLLCTLLAQGTLIQEAPGLGSLLLLTPRSCF